MLSSILISQEKIVLGYYYAAAQYYPQNSIDFSKITHIAHCFVYPDSSGELHSEPGFQYPELISATHQNNKKIILAVGGYGYSNAFGYLCSDQLKRAQLVDDLVTYCANNGYDGIDIDWEFPKQADRENYVAFISELRSRLIQAGKNILSIAVPSYDWENGYNISELKNYVDWFGIMAYDFYGPWESKAGHNSPLYTNNNQSFSVQNSVMIHQNNGMPASKIVLGVPFYGYKYKSPDLYMPHSGASTVTYVQAKNYKSQGWSYYWDNVSKAPYLIDPLQEFVVSYEDTLSLKTKMGFISERNFKGVMIWSLGLDYEMNKTALLDITEKYYLNPPTLPPRYPELISPIDGATELATDFICQWSETDSTLYYHLELDDDPTFQNPVLDESSLNLSSFFLNDLSPGHKYYWRVRSLNIKGASLWSDIWSFQVTEDITKNKDWSAKIHSGIGIWAYPNPFNSQVRVKFSVPIASEVKITLFDMTGRSLYKLRDAQYQPGNYSFNVDFNSFSSSLPSGIYFLQLLTNQYNRAVKLIYLK